MTNYHSIFPLEIVVYPREKVNLHIFEPRYIYMIKNCVEKEKPFVMGVMIKNQLQEVGTFVQVQSIRKEYEDGKLDITVEGLNPVRILEMVKSTDLSLPHNAIVFHPENEMSPVVSESFTRVYELMLNLHQELNLDKKFDRELSDMLSYDFAHHIGLPFEEEYRLLTFLEEKQRLELMRLHLVNILSIVKNLAGLKEKVKLNGHFRNLKGFDFD